MVGVRLRGFPAWFAARTYHLALMPGAARRLRLDHRLDGGAVLRPRLGRARPARPPAAPRRLWRTPRSRGRRGERASASSARDGRPTCGPASSSRPYRCGRPCASGACHRSAAGSEADSWRTSGSASGRCSSSSPASPTASSGCARRRAGSWATSGWPASIPWTSSASWRCTRSGSARGIGNGLLERCWPEPPTRERGRVVVTLGTSPDLTLYTRFGVMPVAGHWHLRLARPVPGAALAGGHRRHRARRARAHGGPGGGGVEAPRAAGHRAQAAGCSTSSSAAPAAVSHVMRGEEARPCAGSARSARSARPWAPRPRTCCPWCWPPSTGWPSRRSRNRSAFTARPTPGGCSTGSGGSGFKVRWPSWVMSSVPLPGLDRYLPTRPARLL